MLCLAYAHGAIAVGLAFGGIGVFMWPIFPFANWLESQGLVKLNYKMFTPIMLANGLVWVFPIWLIIELIWRRSNRISN